MKWEIHKTSFITFLTVLMTHWILNVNCPQTDIFTGDSLYLFLISFTNLTIGCIIWRLGYVFFLKFERWQSTLRKYFILLTILALFPLVLSIWKSSFSSDKQLIQSICSKSEWLPLIPLHSESVIIEYYRDDFLGDYWFNMWIKIPARPKFDSIEFSHLKKLLFEEKNELIHPDQRPFGEKTYHYSLNSGV